MKIHITGSEGFLGKYIVNDLSAHGYKLDLSTHGSLDINSKKELDRFLANEKPDMIVHLAALCGALPSVENPHDFFTTNTQGVINLLDSCRLNGIGKLIFTSSLTVFGSGDEMKNEHSTFNARHPYAYAKICAEYAIKSYHHHYGLSGIILRPTLVVGKNYKEPHAIGDFVETALNNETIKIFGSGNHVRDFVSPHDVATAVRISIDSFAQRTEPYLDSFNISNNEPTKMIDLAKRVVERVGKGRIQLTNPTQQMFSLYTSSKKFQKEHNWRPEYSIDGIIDTIL